MQLCTIRFLRSLSKASDASADELRSQVTAWLEQGMTEIREQDETSPATAAGPSQTGPASDGGGVTSGSAGQQTVLAEAEADESGAAEVDELLMQMSINQEGQVSLPLSALSCS